MKEEGRVLLSSGDLTHWGKATFDAMVARSAFTRDHPRFTCQWVKMVAAADADYRADPGNYDPGTANAAAIARAVSGDAGQVGRVLALYGYPTLEEQVSRRVARRRCCNRPQGNIPVPDGAGQYRSGA